MAVPFPDIPRELVSVPPFKIGGVALGPFAIRWYALAYIAGILLGWRYAVGMVRNARLWSPALPAARDTQIDDLVLWITLGIILGGRTGYVLFYMLPLASSRAALAHDPLEILRLWHGGMSFHGGAIGVGVALVAFARAQRLSCSVWRMSSRPARRSASSSAASPTSSMANSGAASPPRHGAWCSAGGISRPTRTEAASPACNPAIPPSCTKRRWEGVLLFLILRVATHRAGWLAHPGRVTGLFLIFYGLFRIALENVRMPDEGLRNLPLGLTVGMMLSAPMVLAGVFLIWRGSRLATHPGAHDPA